jgi:hypothetical protein
MNVSVEEEEARISRLGYNSNSLHPYKKTSNLNKGTLDEELDEYNMESANDDILSMESRMQ